MTMLNDVLLQLLFGLACIACGFFAGLATGWREYRVKGKAFSAPALPTGDRQKALGLIFVAMLAVVSTTFAAIQSSNQARCNREFRETLVTRSAITTENQRHLNDMIAAIADGITAGGNREQTRQAILTYQRWAEEVEQRRAESPLTDPTCGGEG